jgi:uncharacterized membrane-anchored protein YitT (DUF2179 family)
MTGFSHIFKVFKEYFIITIGLVVFAFAWEAFMIPKGISGGGVPGIASIVYFASGIPVSATYLVINVILIVVGTIILGKGFGFKTIYSILLTSLMFQIMPGIDWIANFSDIPDKFLNAIIGGTISAIGIAMIFMQGGSTGGTDIVALVMSKYREISPGRVFLYCDLFIVGSIYMLPDKGLQDVVYGYLYMVSFSYMVDVMLTGSKQSVQILIFTSKYNEIADILVKEMHRGVTALHSEGWYSHQEGKLLVVVARKQQLNEIKAVVMSVDKHAFISVSSAMSVYGKGFESVKNLSKQANQSNKINKAFSKWIKEQ